MDSINPCTSSAIHDYTTAGYSSMCTYVEDNCADEISTANFFNFYYCTLDQNLAYFIPFSIFFILIAFYAISSVTEHYLEPSLSNIAKAFKFSESLAGVTLVSLANGAPDVISAYAAGANANDGILVPLGALFGAGSFTVCIVLCVCIFVSPGGAIQAEKDALSRDCIFYLIGCVYFMVFGFVGKIYGYTAGGLFAMYAVFIAVVLWSEVKFRKAMTQRLLEEEEEARKRASFLVDYHHANESIVVDYINQHNKVHDSFGIQDELDFIDTMPTQNTVKMSMGMKKYSPHSSHSKILFHYNTLKHRVIHESGEILKKSFFGKLCLLVVIPFRFLADLTIPASNDEQWVKLLAIIHPFTVSAFLIWQFGLIPQVFGNFIGLGVWIGFCLVLSVLIWKLTLKKKVPQGWTGFLFVALAFVTSAVWINLIANIIVDYVTLLSVFTGLPLNYIGLTLLAWGNSAPDFFVDTTLARKGFGQAAISGVFAGQFFNIAIGFGLTLVRQVILFGDREFELKSLSNTAIISMLLIGVLIVDLIVTIIYGYRNKYLLKKNLAVYLLVSYILFFIAVTVLSCI